MTPSQSDAAAQRTPTWLTRDMVLLLCGRALRSLSLGYLTVLVPAYPANAGYSATRVGVVFTAGAVGSMILTAGVGLFADRIGASRSS